MTGEMNILPLPPATQATVRPQVGELLKLLTPVEGLIDAGQSAKAEVLSLKQADQTFQLLLKVTLDNGRQTTVQATSNLPLPQGTSLAITQPSAGNLAITVQQAIASSVAALTRIDTAQLPVGTLLQGKVLTSQVLPQTPGQATVFRSLVTLLNTAQSGSTLTLDSPQPLRIGTLLSALVENAQTLKFLPLSSRQEQLAVSQQLLGQQSRQASLTGVLNALQNLPTDTDQTSQDLRAMVDKLLASLPDVQQLSTGKGVALALANSGAFLEAKLLTGQTPTLAPDMKADLLKLIAQLTPGLPSSTSFNAIIAANTLAQALPNFVRNALGTLGQVSAKPLPSSFPCPTACCKAWKAKAIWNSCCASPLPLFHGCKAINCRVWNRPASLTTAACSAPGSWKSPCATCRTSCRCRSSSSAKKPRNANRNRTSAARNTSPGNNCGASIWRSTWNRSGQCRFRRN